MRRSFLMFRAGLSLWLAGVVGMPLGPVSPAPKANRFLAPHSWTESRESAEKYLLSAVQTALATGTSAEKIDAVDLVAHSLERAQNFGIAATLAVIDKGTVRVGIKSGETETSYIVTARRLQRQMRPAIAVISQTGAIPGLLRTGRRIAEVFSSAYASLFPNSEFSPERRALLARFGRLGLAVAAVGALGALESGCTVNESDRKSNLTPGTSGAPELIGQEKNFDRAAPSGLKDEAAPDTTVVLRARLTNVNPSNAPNFYQVTAVDANGNRAILSPFEPDPGNRFAAVFPVDKTGNFAGGFSPEQTLAARVYQVEENGQLRPVRSGDTFTFRVRALEGTDPFHPRFSTSAPNVFQEVFSLPVSVREPETLIRRGGQPEPGELVRVEQNPAGVINGNDGTLRLTFNTRIGNGDPVKPDYVFVSVMNEATGQFLNGHFVRLGNPTGENFADVPATMIDFANGSGVAPIPTGTPLKITAQNADIGLTPPDAVAASAKTHTLLRDASPAAMARPTLEVTDPATNALVQLVNGTRLAKLRIHPRAMPNDPLKPDSHFVQFTIFDFVSRRNVTFGATVQIPKVFENGVEVPASGQAHDYLVEIPETVFSQNFVDSSLQSVEVFNLRPGYQSVSSGVTDISRSPGNVVTSQAKAASVPQVSQVSTQDTLVRLTIDPRAVSNDVTTAHAVTLRLARQGTGEALDIPFFVELPKRLEVDPQTLQPRLVPETNRPHTFTLTLSDPAVTRFLQGGAADLVSVVASNATDQGPSGAPATQTASGTVQLPNSAAVTETPAIQSAQGAGDTGVNVALRAAGSGLGGSTPAKIFFAVTMRNSRGEEFVETAALPLTPAHLNDRQAVDTYSLTLEHPKIDAATTVRSLVVRNQDANGNLGPIAHQNTNALMNPNRVSRAPAIASLAQKGGQPHVAVITFDIPTQELGGGALPAGKPNVIVEAVTSSGRMFAPTDQGPIFISAADVQVVNGRGVVEVDFSNFGVPSAMTDVFFVLRTQAPGRAFSPRSQAAQGQFLVVASAQTAGREGETQVAAGPRRWSREAFSGSQLRGADSETVSALGAGLAGFFLYFIPRDPRDDLKEALKAEIQQEIEDAGGVPGFTRENLLERLRDLFFFTDLFGAVPESQRAAYLEQILLEALSELEMQGVSVLLPELNPVPSILDFSL